MREWRARDGDKLRRHGIVIVTGIVTDIVITDIVIHPVTTG